ncbi:hypothetical protein EBI01_13865 [Marinomonas rhizomae]|uniref:Uncharacterized protein n=1 Tax=Marinomonas rhizomae TaxID=491948 RepID=A0A366J166_9GAMM|nr:hypothetical protein [Marinomonas rhizomae]RBP80004.1 hypothetical protein DFP80_11260 [Marinomonas rhizomae]RNF71935.1 hypothetical protein EBI01_13865 [Marinomonas rhizomae]
MYIRGFTMRLGICAVFYPDRYSLGDIVSSLVSANSFYLKPEGVVSRWFAGRETFYFIDAVEYRQKST